MKVAQFLIRGTCTVLKPSYKVPTPFTVWVELDSAEPTACGVKGYWLTREGLAEIVSHGFTWGPEAGRFGICEHMGEFIE